MPCNRADRISCWNMNEFAFLSKIPDAQGTTLAAQRNDVTYFFVPRYRDDLIQTRRFVGRRTCMRLGGIPYEELTFRPCTDEQVCLNRIEIHTPDRSRMCLTTTQNRCVFAKVVRRSFVPKWCFRTQTRQESHSDPINPQSHCPWQQQSRPVAYLQRRRPMQC